MRNRLRMQWQAGGTERFAIITAGLFLLALIPSLRGISEQSDVDIFAGAANRLLNLTNMYTAPYKDGMWYYYSPLFASLLVPFTFADIRVLKLLWFLINLGLAFRCFSIFKAAFPLDNQKSSRYLIAAIAILAFHPVFLNLLYGQLTILVVWACMEGFWQIQNQKFYKGFFSFAIGINIKMLPVFFFYYYLLKKNLRVLAGMGFAVIALILIPYIWIPFSFHSEIIPTWLGLLNPLNPEHVNTVGEGGFTDFASLVTKYFTAQVIPNEPTINLTDLDIKSLFWVQNGFRLITCIISALAVLKWHRVFTGNERLWADMSLFLACIPVAFPHQRDYSVMLAVPAMCFLAYLWLKTNAKPSFAVLVLALLAVTLMGSTIFLELFGHTIKYFLFYTRMSGIGGLLFLAAFILWIRQLKPVTKRL